MRVIISLTTVLALVALLFRMWLFTFWSEFKNQKMFYLKLMELQEVAKKQESPTNNPASLDNTQVHQEGEESGNESLTSAKFKVKSNF